MSGQELQEAIQALAAKGSLPDDEIMEEVLTEHEVIAHTEANYT